MCTLEEFINFGGNEQEYYRTFLIQTDHIPNKLIEALVLGEEGEDYSEILILRKEARQKINQL